MTLVVCWRASVDELHCAADTRISQPSATVTDSGAKIFIVPITVSVYDKRLLEQSHYSYGFAFAGATLPATSTHALVTSITQLLHDTAPRPPPSLRSIADLYARIGAFYTRDINSRKVGDYAYFTAFIFGFCPASERLLLFTISPAQTANSFEMKLVEHSPEAGLVYSMGSGADEFDRISTQKGFAPFDAFMSVVKEGKVATVGGYPQIAVARKSGVNIRPILMPDDSNLDQVVLTLLGFNLTQIGKVDGFSVGFEATGVGTEITVGRRALRAKGIDPDSGPVPKGVQNLASIEAALAACIASRAQYALTDTYFIEAPRPVMGDFYFVTICPRCKTMSVVCHDPSRGELRNPFCGPGGVSVKCWSCHEIVSCGASAISPTCWNLPT
jgi:hypothetical protein